MVSRSGACAMLVFFLLLNFTAEAQKPVYPSELIEIPDLFLILDERPVKEKKHDELLVIGDSTYFVGVQYHGSSTMMAPKKSYTVEFRNQYGYDKPVEVLGLPRGSDFILLANFFDATFVRNPLVFHIWRELGHYAPGTRYCNLYINGNYEGLYLFTEKIAADYNSRLHLSYVPEGNQNGEATMFLLKYDRDTKNWMWSIENMEGGYFDYTILYPKGNFGRPMNKNVLDGLDRSLSAAYVNDSTVKSYTDLIDLESFADYFLINEIAKNPDAFISSVYMHRIYDGKIQMGPVWDFDLAFANPINPTDNEPTGWMYQKQVMEGNTRTMPTWWYDLLCKEEFRDLCLLRLAEFERILNEEALKEYFKAQQIELGDAFIRNDLRWLHSNGTSAYFPGPFPATFKETTDPIISFLQARLKWVRENLSSIPCNPSFGVMHEKKRYERIVSDSSKNELIVQFDQDMSPRSTVPQQPFMTTTYNYTIYDYSGKVLETGELKGKSQKFFCKGWPKGTYFMKIRENSYKEFLATSMVYMVYEIWYELALE